ncbi:hypothetical protein OG963_42930 (plasmid) [Streptomyces sp. NBC_01707]|uniref:hypothetical protein n=1 Tax=Streptomyces sp. NBC_01707 TaxID=2975914 RepID=UPI00352CA000
MKNYPPEFKADAVALYESRPDARIRSVAAVLDGGRTKGTQEVRILTAAGLDTAGIELDRAPEEMARRGPRSGPWSAPGRSGAAGRFR